MTIISFDVHKRYTWACVEDEKGQVVCEERVNHKPGCFETFLSRFPAGSPVAVETIGNWYWVTDEIERAGMRPHLVNAGRAKLLMGQANKTDKLDARGLNRLQRTGVLPTVWIASESVREKRELLRTRMVCVRQKTGLKNRIHAAISKYGLPLIERSDIFGVGGQKELEGRVSLLPEQARFAATLLLDQIHSLEQQIDRLEERIEQVFDSSEDRERLRTLPGIGTILSTVILTEIGNVTRFPSAENLASYAGTTPRVYASGGKIRIGRLRIDVNHYLKWAFVEAANVVCRNRRRWPDRHVARLYNRIAHKKGHAVAIGAVARHLAEATFWVLTRKEAYRDPVARLSNSR